MSPGNTMHIACAADNNYIQHAGVMLTSLLENNRSHSIHLHFFSADFNVDNQNILRELVEGYRQTFSYYPLEPSAFKDCVISHHVSLATYYRILIPLAITPTITKLLYLDTDMIIDGEIRNLWETPVNGKVVAAVREPSFSDFEKLNIPTAHGYFNAGVLVMNIEEWNKREMSRKVLDYISRNPEKLTFWDQDALNANLHDSWLSMPPVWNNQSAFYELSPDVLDEMYGEVQLEQALSNPAIIHYTGSSKPWDYLNMHPLKHLYHKYLALTPWKNYRYPQVTFVDRFKKVLIRLMGIKTFQRVGTMLQASK